MADGLVPSPRPSPLAQFDIRERLAPLPHALTELLVGLCCIGVEATARLLLDMVAPGVAPFALVYPGAMIATLFAGWRCGIGVLAASILFGWYFVLQPQNSFELVDARDPRVSLPSLAPA